MGNSTKLEKKQEGTTGGCEKKEQRVFRSHGENNRRIGERQGSRTEQNAATIVRGIDAMMVLTVNATRL